MTNEVSEQQEFKLAIDHRDRLAQDFGNLLKKDALNQQSLREQSSQSEAEFEALFLELLEVVDSLDGLLNYLLEHPEPEPQFFQRLPKSLGVVQRNLLNILKKRQVNPIELQGEEPDYNTCRIVDREVRNDLPDKTITKVLRQGFRLKDKILRPVEVITSKLES